MLIEMQPVINILSELQQNFESFDSNDLYERYLTARSEADEWKISSGDLFSCLPYEEQRQGFPAPKLIKKKYESIDQARWAGKYCAGFRAGKHIITLMPGQKTVHAVDVDLYNESDDLVEICNASYKGIDRSNGIISRLTGMAKMQRVDETRKLYVSVGAAGAYAVYLYTYSTDGKPLNVTAFSKGWRQESHWEFHYTSESELIEITSGAATLWKQK